MTDINYRLKKIIHLTGLDSRFKYTEEEGKQIIELSLNDEFDNNVQILKQFYSTNNLNDFIDRLEKLYILSSYFKFNIKLVPEYGNIKILINNRVIDYRKIDIYYSKLFLTIIENIQKKIEILNDKSDKIALNNSKELEYSSGIEDMIERAENIQNDEKLKKSLRKIVLSEGSVGYVWPTKTYKHEKQEKLDVNEIINIFKEFERTFYQKQTNQQIGKFWDNFKTSTFNHLLNGDKFTIEIDDIKEIENMDIFYIIFLLDECINFSEEILLKQRKKIQNQKDIIKSLNQEILDFLKNNNKMDIEKMREASKEKKPTSFEDINFEFKSDNIPKKENFINSQNDKFEHMSQEVINNLQNQQLENLTQEEKDSLYYYKLCFYQVINETKKWLIENNLTVDEINSNGELYETFRKFISHYYLEYKRTADMDYSSMDYKKYMQSFSSDIMPRSVQNVFKRFDKCILPFDEYAKIVINGVKNIQKAIKKIRLNEDIVVYRYSSDALNTLDNKRFISTSLSLDFVKSLYTINVISPRPQNGTLAKINIPAGSNVIIYTSDLFIDDAKEGEFGDTQKEILIDMENFEPVMGLPITDTETIYNRTQITKLNTVEYFLQPKKLDNTKTI